jgi:hypothetical protein
MFRICVHLNKLTRSFSVLSKGGERQKHGFKYESNVIKKYNLVEIKSYTAEYDGIYKDIPVQIKCSKQGTSIEMGDYRRNKTKCKDFILAIGLWQTDNTNITHNPNDTKFIQKEYFLYVEHSKYTKHLGYYNDYIEHCMYDDFKQITNHVDDDIKWNEFCNKYKSLWKQENMMSVRFRRDHKKQKRIQCGVSWRNFNEWMLKEFDTISLDISPLFNKEDYENYLIL